MQKALFLLRRAVVFAPLLAAWNVSRGAPPVQDSVRLTVHVERVPEARGCLLVGIYDQAEDAFDVRTQYAGYKEAAQKGMQSHTFRLPRGRYAVGVIHDKNDNGVLDRNFLGIPNEPYGFSGGASRPDFDKACFPLLRDTVIYIRLK